MCNFFNLSTYGTPFIGENLVQCINLLLQKKIVFVVRLYDVDVGAGVFWGPSDSFIICVEISAQIADFLGGR